jgi:hypothetical protein
MAALIVSLEPQRVKGSAPEDAAASGRGRLETFFGFKVSDHDGFPFFFPEPDETPGSRDETLDFRDGEVAAPPAPDPCRAFYDPAH